MEDSKINTGYLGFQTFLWVVSGLEQDKFKFISSAPLILCAGSLLQMLSGFFWGNQIPFYSLEEINCCRNAVGLASRYQGCTQEQMDF